MNNVNLAAVGVWDPILSGDRDVACATCHHPSHAYADGRAISIGVGGSGLGPARRSGALTRPMHRNSMTILDVAWNGLIATTPSVSPEAAPMFWDSRERSLETQALKPLQNQEEMRGDTFSEEQSLPELVRRLSVIPQYVDRFATAFGMSDEGLPVSHSASKPQSSPGGA